MQKIIFNLLIIYILFSCGNNTEDNANIDYEMIQTEVYAIADSIGKHMVQLNFEKITNYFNMEELTVILNGRFYPDGQEWFNWWVNRSKDRYISIDSFINENYRIHVLSPTSAVYIGTYKEFLQRRGEPPTTVNGTWMLALKKVDEKWEIVSQHLSHPRNQ